MKKTLFRFFFILILPLTLCLLFQGEPLARSASKRSRSSKSKAVIGDIAFRFDAGVELFRLSMASGEPISEAIAERAVRLRLNFEYGYFMSNSLALFIALPIEFNIDPTVGTSLDIDLGLGFRTFLGGWFYIDGRALISFVSRSRFVFVLGGLAIGVGAAIPVTSQVRLLINARVPLYFVGGFRIRIQSFMGFEVLF